ncbi:hypothetical protein PUN28_006969 [Cardiocondyla obscurior]|uniref:Uncharacterized protein n=1 Tax=Cardiocondyla obscurior TaxID=286306 RepID=A0AAW2G1B8_9HYME
MKRGKYVRVRIRHPPVSVQLQDAWVDAAGVRKFIEHERYSSARWKLKTKSWLARDQHLSRSWLRPLKSQDPRLPRVLCLDSLGILLILTPFGDPTDAPPED